MFEKVQNFVNQVQKTSDLDFEKNYPNTFRRNFHPVFEIETAIKYYKVYRCEYQNRETKTGLCAKSIHCFIDIETGDIFKPSSYKMPAKGKRGNVNNEKLPLTFGSLYR